MLELGDDAKRMRIVIKAALCRHQGLDGIFARMAEGRVAEIMGQRQGFGQIIIQ